MAFQKAMLRTLPPTNWSQISAEIPSSLVIMSQRVWNGGEGGMEEKGGGSQTSVTLALTGVSYPFSYTFTFHSYLFR